MEQSTKSLPLTSHWTAVAIVSVIAASSPRQVKMMSDLVTASSIVLATVDLPSGSLACRSMARWVVLLKMIKGELSSPCYEVSDRTKSESKSLGKVPSLLCFSPYPRNHAIS